MARGQFQVVVSGVAGVLAVEAETAHAFPRHSHEQFGFGLIERGAQRSLSGRGMVEAGAGDLITVNPGEVHDGAPIGAAGRAWRMLYLDPALIIDAAYDANEGRRRTCEFVRPVLREEALTSTFRSLYGALTAPGTAGSDLLRDEALAVLVDRLVCEQPLEISPAVPAAIRIAQEVIDDDPTAPVILSELARASGLSRFQVVRGFSRAFGLTPHAYLVQRRIDLARQLIKGGAALADAAAASGFADQSHMTRHFVRRFGFSPGALLTARP
ncbi:AraC family transcriptional regulator [Microvirga arabica]|uniref:AraC family transcriptional regulator n=1 Tax=Microvirga arabica TaxID=1128671 RepID=A0ABV6Y5E9_9HYPH